MAWWCCALSTCRAVQRGVFFCLSLPLPSLTAPCSNACSDGQPGARRCCDRTTCVRRLTHRVCSKMYCTRVDHSCFTSPQRRRHCGWPSRKSAHRCRTVSYSSWCCTRRRGSGSLGLSNDACSTPSTVLYMSGANTCGRAVAGARGAPGARQPIERRHEAPHPQPRTQTPHLKHKADDGLGHARHVCLDVAHDAHLRGGQLTHTAPG